MSCKQLPRPCLLQAAVTGRITNRQGADGTAGALVLLTAELEALATANRVATLDTSEIKRGLSERAGDVKALLGQHTPQARQMLPKLLDGKIVMEPVTDDGRRGYRLSGQLNVGRLLQGETFQAIEATAKAAEDNSLTVVAPTGSEPGLIHLATSWRQPTPGGRGGRSCDEASPPR